MKKIISVFVSLIIFAGCLSSCGSKTATNTGTGEKNDGGMQIVTTIFPEYDWVMNILGDNPGNAQVTMLLDNGVDLHSYQPRRMIL